MAGSTGEEEEVGSGRRGVDCCGRTVMEDDGEEAVIVADDDDDDGEPGGESSPSTAFLFREGVPSANVM